MPSGVSDSEVSGGGSDCEEEAPASAAEVALGVALSQLSAIKLDTRLLQALSTCRLTPQQLTDTSLDLLTGWHLVDGRERVVAVEGRAEGAMTAIQVSVHCWNSEVGSRGLSSYPARCACTQQCSLMAKRDCELHLRNAAASACAGHFQLGD